MSADDVPLPDPGWWASAELEEPKPVDGRRVVDEAVRRARLAASEWGRVWTPEDDRD